MRAWRHVTGTNEADLVADFPPSRHIKASIFVFGGGWIVVAVVLAVAFFIGAPRIAVVPVFLAMFGIVLFTRMNRVRVMVYRDRIFIRNFFGAVTLPRTEVVAFEAGHFGRLKRTAAINVVTRGRRIGLDGLGRRPPLTQRQRAERDANLDVLQDWLRHGIASR